MNFNSNRRNNEKSLTNQGDVLTNLIISQLLSAQEYQIGFKLTLRQ